MFTQLYEKLRGITLKEALPVEDDEAEYRIRRSVLDAVEEVVKGVNDGDLLPGYYVDLDGISDIDYLVADYQEMYGEEKVPSQQEVIAFLKKIKRLFRSAE